MSLQPFEYDPAEKNKHKFMVQSMFAPDGEINQDTLVGTELDKVVIYILQFSVEGDWPEWSDGQQVEMCVCHASWPGGWLMLNTRQTSEKLY